VVMLASRFKEDQGEEHACSQLSRIIRMPTRSSHKLADSRLIWYSRARAPRYRHR
jgi:hypothetical protein